jgi:very-short-patch-repair endonuclease
VPTNEYCWKCGKVIDEFEYKEGMYWGRFCYKCFCEHDAEHKETVNEYLKLRNKIMFDRAMRFMERSPIQSMTRFKRYAIAVQRHSAENLELYKSAHEMVTAVILLEAGIDFEINYKVGKYAVDFFIPDWDLIVEIDGERHDNREVYDSNRDVQLRQMLGSEWEVIRIPTKYVEQDPEKLPDAIKTLAKQKRDIRKKNGGFLPQSYSKREAAKYKKAMVYDEIHVKA